MRERADWQCERCHKQFPDRKGAGLHCSHFWGRRSKAVRWHGDNCFALCFACHKYVGENPHEHARWVKNQLGQTRYDELTLRANQPKKYTKAEQKEMVAHFRAQLEYLQRRRRDGETGYIDFVDWD